MTRYVAIGDIHGMIDELQQLFSSFALEEDDVLVFLGDYVDRGTNSRAVLDYLMNPWWQNKTVYLRGNHEDMLLKRKTSPAHLRIWLGNGGLKCLEDFGMDMNKLNGSDQLDVIPPEYTDWLAKTQLTYQPEGTGMLFVHAGINPEYPFYEQTEQDLMWIRDVFLKHEGNFGPLVVHGHTPTMGGVEVRHNRINVDGGSCFDGYLNAVVLSPDGTVLETHSVKCQQP